MNEKLIFILVSVMCVFGWIAYIFFEIKIGGAFAAFGHLGQGYFAWKNRNKEQ